MGFELKLYPITYSYFGWTDIWYMGCFNIWIKPQPSQWRRSAGPTHPLSPTSTPCQAWAQECRLKCVQLGMPPWLYAPGAAHRLPCLSLEGKCSRYRLWIHRGLKAFEIKNRSSKLPAVAKDSLQYCLGPKTQPSTHLPDALGSSFPLCIEALLSVGLRLGCWGASVAGSAKEVEHKCTPSTGIQQHTLSIQLGNLILLEVQF